MSAQQLWNEYQTQSATHGEWSDEAHAAWSKWAMVAGRLATASI